MSETLQDEVADISEAQSLRELDDQLTAVMAARHVQEFIHGDRLSLIVQRAQALCELDSAEERLLLASVLGRLAAVARGRSGEVFEGFQYFMTEPPASLAVLQDGDEKAYAALALANLGELSPAWLSDYVIREAFALDAAENARKALLIILRDHSDDYLAILNSLAQGFDGLQIEAPDARLRRVKRVLEAWKEVAQDHFWALEANPGEAISRVVKAAMSKVTGAKEEALANEVGDLLFELLLRVVQLRFSYALESATYAPLATLKAHLGTRLWTYLRGHSAVKPRVLSCLREACLVLARQGQTDMAMLDAMKVMYATRTSMGNDLRRHFEGHHELDSEVAEWWTSGGTKRASNAKKEKSLKSDEDMLIGQLLLEGESARRPLDNVRTNLLPLIEEFVHDPVVAASLRKGLGGFVELSTVLRQLCRMRRLELSELEGEIITYNRTRHEMVSGHQPGVTKVRVVRDQVVQKLYGRERVVVKALVEPV
ncbi:hypothetical protein KZO25_10155 [Halomonas sp. ANAO-440]|uniref:hypothetical protein n=1 Tax=Halomonas sp. ANAO-440 TaxID=2861360 RepID=UPI001CAA76E9|nr:hypothetical protein [Halomonas sp. ANAO-440]MBZ0330675.1 hypothetical protein [Halomonas sp. ANAO-440]